MTRLLLQFAHDSTNRSQSEIARVDLLFAPLHRQIRWCSSEAYQPTAHTLSFWDCRETGWQGFAVMLWLRMATAARRVPAVVYGVSAPIDTWIQTVLVPTMEKTEFAFFTRTTQIKFAETTNGIILAL